VDLLRTARDTDTSNSESQWYSRTNHMRMHPVSPHRATGFIEIHLMHLSDDVSLIACGCLR
jgi:hypothetical protein